jgi:hypothetical protein
MGIPSLPSGGEDARCASQEYFLLLAALEEEQHGAAPLSSALSGVFHAQVHSRELPLHREPPV